MMSFIQQFYQDCLVKFALMGHIPLTPFALQNSEIISTEFLNFYA